MLATHQSFIIPCPTLQQVQSAGSIEKLLQSPTRSWPILTGHVVLQGWYLAVANALRASNIELLKALVRACLTTTVHLRLLVNAQVDGSLHAMKEASVHKQKLGCYHAGKTVTSFGRICP